jgi:hypothetical protein
MPTGTSTIFGVFQAIWLSFSKKGELPPSRDKVMQTEKFASEIFVCLRGMIYVASQNDLHIFVRRDVKPMADQKVQG